MDNNGICKYLSQGGYLFTWVCLSVCLLTGLRKTRLLVNFFEILWNDWTARGPID